MSSGPAVNMALFIDVENMISGASALGLPIDLGPVMDRLKGQGRVLIRRAYGDIRKCLEQTSRLRQEDSIRRMLVRNLVQIEDIPYTTAHKNTADMRIVVDALSEAFTNHAISHFVILSSDRDYVPLCNKLHELNKTVISIVVDQANVNPMVIEAADRVEYYETYFPAPAAAKPAAASPESETRTEDVLAASQLVALREEYFRVLQQAIRALEADHKRPVAAAVSQKMPQLRSDFNPANLGLKSFKEFAEAAEKEKVVKVDWGDRKSDFVMTLGEALPEPSRPTPALSPHVADRRQRIVRLAKDYQRFLEEKLKVRLPSFAARKEILEAAEETRELLLAEGEGGFYLTQWKDKIRAKFPTKYDEKTVFKMLLSLHYARCFYIEEGMLPGDPLIVGLKLQPNKWEAALITNLARQLQLEHAFRPLDREALAECFYPDRPDSSARIEAILAEVK